MLLRISGEFLDKVWDSDYASHPSFPPKMKLATLLTMWVLVQTCHSELSAVVDKMICIYSRNSHKSLLENTRDL